jgi:two-component sensor histidine kinase/PAS domain-containing protein
MARHAILANLSLAETDLDFLETVIGQMPIVADLSRADLLLYVRKNPEELVIVSHAQPHSLAHVYNHGRSGRVVQLKDRREIQGALSDGSVHTNMRSIISEGAPVIRETLPVYSPVAARRSGIMGNGYPANGKRVIAAVVIVTNLIEHERHKFRSSVYRRELRKLQAMMLAGLVTGAETLSPFGEQDGILFVDRDGIIQYASGVAANLYRKIGYIDTLVGRHLRDLETGDEKLFNEVLANQRCLERETKEGDRYWSRKVVPVINYIPPYLSLWERAMLMRLPDQSGVLIILHDDTEARRQDEELRIKNAMIQEVHHRVKNNLQTIAGLLRMQSRRVKSDEAKTALDEALNRILSVAVIHEFLSDRGSSIINIKEVSSRIISQFQQGMLNPDKQVNMRLTGDSISLPARQATACSLIINELLQNSLEHGFENRTEGNLQLSLADDGEQVTIVVADDGNGVDDDFSLGQSGSLGLQIVKILVEDDLKGSVTLGKGLDDVSGLGITIVFNKTLFEGEYGWAT